MSGPKLGKTFLSFSYASFKLFIRRLSRALAASRRFFMTSCVTLIVPLFFAFLPDFCDVTVVYDPVDVDAIDAADVDGDKDDNDDGEDFIGACVAGVLVIFV